MARWPNPAACAAAPLGDVIAAWTGLGYNRRAVFLHRAAVRSSTRHGGVVPADRAGLMALPGVGAYTARAVLAFAFDQPVGVVDTNAARVLARAVAGRRLDGPAVRTWPTAWCRRHGRVGGRGIRPCSTWAPPSARPAGRRASRARWARSARLAPTRVAGPLRRGHRLRPDGPVPWARLEVPTLRSARPAPPGPSRLSPDPTARAGVACWPTCASGAVWPGQVAWPHRPCRRRPAGPTSRPGPPAAARSLVATVWPWPSPDGTPPPAVTRDAECRPPARRLVTPSGIVTPTVSVAEGWIGSDRDPGVCVWKSHSTGCGVRAPAHPTPTGATGGTPPAWRSPSMASRPSSSISAPDCARSAKPSRLDGTFRGTALLTHIHWDHVQGLPFFPPADRVGARFDVFGPQQEEGTLAEVLDDFIRPPYFPVTCSELRGDIVFHDVLKDDLTVGHGRGHDPARSALRPDGRLPGAMGGRDRDLHQRPPGAPRAGFRGRQRPRAGRRGRPADPRRPVHPVGVRGESPLGSLHRRLRGQGGAGGGGQTAGALSP